MKKRVIYTFMMLLLVFTASCNEDEVIGSSRKNIIDFNIGEYNSIIDQDNKTIYLEIGLNQGLTNLIPTITIPDGAVISPASEEVQDFTNPVTYTVTAEDGSTSQYTISVTVPNAFISVWNLSDGEFTLPIDGEYKDYINVDWGDGSPVTPVGVISHNYAEAGEYITQVSHP